MEGSRDPSAAPSAAPQDEHLAERQGSPTALEQLLQDACSRAAASDALAEHLHAALQEQQQLLEALAERAAAAEQAAAQHEGELLEAREQLRQTQQEAELATGWVRQLAHAVEQAQRQAAAGEAAAADRCEHYRVALAALGDRLAEAQGRLQAAEGRAAESEREAAALGRRLRATQQRLAIAEAALLGQQQMQEQQQMQQQRQPAQPVGPPPSWVPSAQVQPLAVALAMLPGAERQLRMRVGDTRAGAGLRRWV